MYRYVVTLKWTDVSEVRTASIIREIIHRPETPELSGNPISSHLVASQQ
jgi:hypothetical protein